MSERRRYERTSHSGLVFISWKSKGGPRNHVLGRALNVSERGIVVDVTTRLPLGTVVKVRAYGLNVDGFATVRRLSRVMGGYALGLELDKGIDAGVLEDLSVSPIQLVSATFNATAFFQ
jgi:hypothetical protein